MKDVEWVSLSLARRRAEINRQGVTVRQNFKARGMIMCVNPGIQAGQCGKIVGQILGWNRQGKSPR